ncbi:MAG: nucleoside triphosphate pyrophosphohydrolase family protein [FCB group bacterium]|nr:nucleoside triphosphate pyrophosphohydrolase family protein [FCB group bacterium]
MQKLINDVKAFMQSCDQPIVEKPAMPGIRRQLLRMDLISEELVELQIAVDNDDLVEIADAIGDSIYVLVGMAIEFGIPLAPVWDEIQRSNMAKVDPETGKVVKRKDGKVLKPEGWKSPDIAGIIDRAKEK